jgi:glycosyltransferase involved in cell wall biosynthesis
VTLRLSVVVPAFQEAGRIASTVKELASVLDDSLGSGTYEVIVVDDGSDDGTANAAEAADVDGVRVIRLPVNRGKGAAVRAGALAANGAVIAFTDADLSYAPSHLIRLMRRVEEGCDMVVGNRYHADATARVRAGVVREISGRVFNLTTRLLLGLRWRDTQCGLKAFSRSAARILFAESRVDGFAFDVELFLLAAKHGFTVCEVPVDLNSAAGSTVQLRSDAVRMVRDLLELRRRLVRPQPDNREQAQKPQTPLQ